jgi:hypothetical protein
MISAILAERRAELGLLLAVGIRGWQLVRLILAEAVIVTTVVTHSPNLAPANGPNHLPPLWQPPDRDRSLARAVQRAHQSLFRGLKQILKTAASVA